MLFVHLLMYIYYAIIIFFVFILETGSRVAQASFELLVLLSSLLRCLDHRCVPPYLALMFLNHLLCAGGSVTRSINPHITSQKLLARRDEFSRL